LANVHEVNLLLKRSKEKIVEAVNKTKHRRRRRRRRRIIVIVIALILFLCVFVLFELHTCINNEENDDTRKNMKELSLVNSKDIWYLGYKLLKDKMYLSLSHTHTHAH